MLSSSTSSTLYLQQQPQKEQQEKKYKPYRMQQEQKDTIERDSIEEKSMECDTNRRVKIYELTLSSTWEDKGTGYVSIEYVEERYTFCILVRSEVDNRILLETALLKGNDVYQRQQDTLIVWTEIDGRDLALSFQVAQGCLEIMDMINDLQNKLPETNIIVGEDVFVDLKTLQKPPIDLNHLPEVEMYVATMLQQQIGREKLVDMVLQENLFNEIYELFEIAEDMEMPKELSLIFNITRQLISLNDEKLFLHLLTRDNCIKLCAIFEHDPDYPIPRGRYRKWLEDETRFKSIAEFKDNVVEERIHIIYRAQFLKDVVFARIVDDPQFNVLHSIIMLYQMCVLQSISNDDIFINDLCQQLKSNSTENKDKILYFIQEFAHIARNYDEAKRKFYQALAAKGILQELETFIVHSNPSLRMVVADILGHLLDFDAHLLRSFVATQRRLLASDQKTMSQLICEALISEIDPGIKYYHVELLKQLLDTSVSKIPLQQDDYDFLSLFYQSEIEILLKPLMEPCFKSELDVANIQSVSDILILLIRIHTGRIKSFILRQGLLLKLGELLKSPLGYIRLIPIRIIKAILQTSDEFYVRYIVKNDVMRPIMKDFDSRGDCYNMFNSSVLDLLEFVNTSHNQSMIEYLVDSFTTELSRLTYVSTGRVMLELRHTQPPIKSSAATTSSKDSVETAGKAWEKEDDREEAYFSRIDNEDEENVEKEKIIQNDEPPPLPKQEKEDDDDDDDFLRIKSHGQIKKQQSRILVDYPSDEDGDETSTNNDKNNYYSTNNKSIKRLALDESDPRRSPQVIINKKLKQNK